MTKLSADKIARTAQALDETITLLVNALKRSPEIRDEELINFYRSHIITLQTRLSDAKDKPFWQVHWEATDIPNIARD